MSEEASNVRVAMRCRPLNRTELAASATSCFRVEGGKVVLKNPVDGVEHDFVFDHMYDPLEPQQTVYEDNGAPLLDKAFAGFNGTIFAYGQTGARVYAWTLRFPGVYFAQPVVLKPTFLHRPFSFLCVPRGHRVRSTQALERHTV